MIYLNSLQNVVGKKNEWKSISHYFFHCHLVGLMKIAILVEFTTMFIYFDFR